MVRSGRKIAKREGGSGAYYKMAIFAYLYCSIFEYELGSPQVFRGGNQFTKVLKKFGFNKSGKHMCVCCKSIVLHKKCF
jgi:hypothetical protein